MSVKHREIEYVTTPPKHPALLIVGIMAFYVVMADFTLLTPAVETVYQHFSSTTDYSTVLMSVSITGIVSFPTSIVFGMLYDKFGYKRLGLIGILIVAIGGSFPFLLADTLDYSAVLVSRVIVGFGLGAVNPIGSALVTRFFCGKTRIRLLGIGNTVMYSAATGFAIMSGALASTGWNFTFLGYAVAIIPFVVALLFLREPEKVAAYESAEKGQTAIQSETTSEQQIDQSVKPKRKAPLVAYGYIAFYFVYCVGNFAIVQLMSTMIAEFNIGSPLVAGFATSAFTIGGIIGGLVFSPLYKKFDKWFLPIILIFAAASAIGLFVTHSLAFILVLSLVDGCANTLMLSFVEERIGATCPQERVATLNGVLMGAMNLGTFLGAYYITAVGVLFPALGLFGTRLITGVMYLAAAVVSFIGESRAPRFADRNYPYASNEQMNNREK